MKRNSRRCSLMPLRNFHSGHFRLSWVDARCHMLPDDFIDTAERLLAGAPEESDKRSAVSRSYYGAFHACLGSLPLDFIPAESDIQSGESHKAIIAAITLWGKGTQPGRTYAQQAARMLSKLKFARRRADYDISENLDSGDVDYCIGRSRKVIQLIRDARSRFDKEAA